MDPIYPGRNLWHRVHTSEQRTCSHCDVPEWIVDSVNGDLAVAANAELR